MSAISDAFLTAARKALTFLEEDLGFVLFEYQAPPSLGSAGTSFSVTYRRIRGVSDDLFVWLGTTPARLDRDLIIGRGWPPTIENKMWLGEMLAIEEPAFKLEFTSGIHGGFGDVNLMSDQYMVLADALRRFGGRFFANDSSLWEALRLYREAQASERQRDSVSREAATAFKNCDWRRANQLLETLGEHGSQLEIARLAYAIKQIERGPDVNKRDVFKLK